jgi:serine protease
MRRIRPAVAVLAALLTLATPAGAWRGAAEPGAPTSLAEAAEPKGDAANLIHEAPDRVVVKWKDFRAASDGSRRHGLTQLLPSEAAGAAVVATGGRSVDVVVAELLADPGVAWAEPDYAISVAGEVQATPVAVNDPLTAQQYALDRMHVREAWSIETGGTNVVAVLDTGVWAAHPDLAGRLVAGYDFVNHDSNPADDNTHGTWVSGIIAANANDGYGVAGISWTDKIMPVKVMDENGSGWTSDVAAGIHWAVDHGASVINMSIAGFADSQVLREAIDYAWAHDVVMVGAAGNNRSTGPVYPASYQHVISVSATQADDEFTNWSNYGADIDVSAPGGSILTTSCNRSTVSTCRFTGMHIVISGTSFAAPNVAGVVALLRARNPGWSNGAVVSRIQATADDVGYAGWDVRYGYGRVNAARALGAITVAPASSPGDALESNNVFASAKVVAVGTTFHPSIHPAGDVDFFAFDLPRAGRLDVTVTPVLDTVRLPKSSLPVDPVLQLYDGAAALLLRVDDPNDSTTTERASIQRSGRARVVLRVSNWFPNGNRAAYSVTTAFVDNVAPQVLARTPAPGATGVPFNGSFTVTFNEAVNGVSASTVLLRDAGGQLVPSGVTYDATTRRATLRPNAPLGGELEYRLVLSASIKDVAGNALVGEGWGFTTGKADRRLSGADRYATAAAVSAAGFAPGVPVAYVATGSNFPDALAAGPLAARAGGPILLVSADHLPAATATELIRLRPATIVVLGGTGAVSDEVAGLLRGYATSGSVTRLSGADRYATAAAVSAAGWAANGPATVFLATGETFADAMAAAPLAGARGVPLLLTDPASLSPATAAELLRLDPSEVIVLGSNGAVSDHVIAELRALWN